MSEYELSSLRYAASRAAAYRPYAPLLSHMTTEEFVRRVNDEPQLIQHNRKYLLSLLPNEKE